MIVRYSTLSCINIAWSVHVIYHLGVEINNFHLNFNSTQLALKSETTIRLFLTFTLNCNKKCAVCRRNHILRKSGKSLVKIASTLY